MHTYLKDKYKHSSDKAWFVLGDGLGLDRPEGSAPLRPDIDPGLAGHYHRQLMALTGPIRQVLKEKRGFTDKTLVDKQLGWDGERITIPIYDEYNRLVNIRRYKWDAPEGNRKVLNYSDEYGNTYGELRIFGIENLVDDSVDTLVWCEGETDRIITEQYGFFAACPTSGAGSWDPAWLPYFRNKKRVILVQDNDTAGRNASAKIADRLHSVCEVAIINWPEEFKAKGDITDFFISPTGTKEAFKTLLDGATVYTGKGAVASAEVDKEAISVHLADSSNATLFGKRIKVPVLISGKDTSPYICPKKVTFFCGDKCDMENKKCQVCALSKYGGEYRHDVMPTDQSIMKLIKCSETYQLSVLREAVNVNDNCKVVSITIDEYQNVEEVRLIPKAETDIVVSKDKEYCVRMGYIVDTPIKTNKRYTLFGSMYPEPNTQQAYYVFDRAVPDKDLASNFELTDEAKECLDVFKLKEGEKLVDKINEIHEDMERNVTKVWDRKEVAIAVDLVYNSALSFYFQDSFVKRGWAELLIIGDSGQAKSTLVERLMQHYKLGEMLSGESSKRTGLIYNLQQTQKRWMLQWGAFPLNDAGLLCIDELSGLSEDDLALMSDVRTSGIAKVTGVITSETTSRTRAIYISNPRNGRLLNTETYGVETVLKLFGKTEDVRRLDMAMAVASGDVDARVINRSIADMTEVPHVYTSDKCNARTLWVWSRKPDNIIITPDALKVILKHATKMGEFYSSKIPIVEAADQRLKIARLAIACAGMVVSTDASYENIIVEPCHVEYVVKFMETIYSKPSFGYDRFSSDDRVSSDSSDSNISRLRKLFLVLPIADHNGLVESLYKLSYMDRYSLADYTGLVQADLSQIIRFLTQNSLVERCKGGYRRTPLGSTFIEMCKKKPFTREEKVMATKEMYSNEEY